MGAPTPATTPGAAPTRIRPSSNGCWR